MFLEHILPLLNKGIKFNLEISLTPAKEICVDVNPISTGSTSLVLPWKQFTGSLEEFNSIGGITGVMQSFAATTKSLAEQLEDTRVVAQAVAEQAAKDAAEAAKVEKPKSVRGGKAAPAGLLADPPVADAEDDHNDDVPQGSSGETPTANSEEAAPALNPDQLNFML